MDFYDDYQAIVAQVANEYGRRYRQYGVDREDFTSECWVWIMDHPRKLEEYLEADQPDKLIARSLRNHCYDAGESVKAQHLGYSRDDLTYYSRTMLRELLPFLWDEDAWIHPERAEDGRRGAGDPATGGNWIATLADVSRAFDQLDEEDRNLLIGFHRDDLRNKDMAELSAVGESLMSYRHDSAVRRLQRLLGGSRPHPEHDEGCEHEYRWGMGRQAVSNAAARAQQQDYWSED